MVKQLSLSTTFTTAGREKELLASILVGCSLISHELLDESYIYAYHQNELNEEIKIMRFICRFNVYFSRNQRKCSQNGVDENLKI